MKKRELGIVAYKCKKCGKVHYPFHDRCLVCKNREFEQIKPQGTPRLLTWTRIFNLPWGFDVRYLTIGVVEFENGVKAMGQIDVDEKVHLDIGQCLNATWEPVRMTYGEPVYGLMLRP
jgi:uncharacterized OB-fold protein